MVLNACEGARGSELDVFSSTAATLVQRHIPAVLAMQYEISDQAALLLVEWFYESLTEGLPVDAAVAEAHKAIASASAHTLEWGTPVLFMRAKDGRIFDVRPAPGGQPAPAASEKPDKSPPAPAAAPKAEPQLRQPTPKPRPAFAAPPAGIAIPNLVKGAAPLKIEWCWIPGGPFKMGSKDYDSEKPIHEVHVDGFWLARYPVTNAQYKLFIEARGYDQQKWWTAEGWQRRQQDKWVEPRYWQDSKWNGAQQPVVGVSWYEAMAFCAWAAEASGELIGLPTEAEWEKGARGTDGRTFPWGEAEPNEKLCHFNQDWSKGSTKPVGQFSPQGDSPYGCADMAGNVYDWTADWFQAYPGNSKPNDAYGEKYRVVRGGSWGLNRLALRCANRGRNAPGIRLYDVGFRCASTAF